MRKELPAVHEVAAAVVAVVRRLRRGAPTFILAVDGPSGSGKSEIADVVARSLDAARVESDDFYASSLTDSDWEARTDAERARDCIDWKRLRREVLLPFRSGLPAVWHPFDWDSGPLEDRTFPLRPDPRRLEPCPVLVLDGAYSSRAELAELLDMTVLVTAAEATRRRRQASRDGAEFLQAWCDRWAGAEAHYFTTLRPPEAFDLVVQNP